MSYTSSTASFAIRSFVVGSTIWLSSAMVSTSVLFLPAIAKPLLIASASSLSAPPTKSAHPSLPTADSRLTPLIEKSDTLSTPSSTSTARHTASQFTHLDVLAFRAQVPLELFTILNLSLLAYTTRHVPIARSSILARPWVHYTASAVLLAAVFPFTGVLMRSLVHKLARIAGEEEPVEPYEDAPLDVEAERENALKFLTQYLALNTVRSGLVIAAGAFAVRGWVLEA